MDIASGCERLNKDVSTVLELSWALRIQGIDLWTSNTYAPRDRADLEGFDPAEVILIVDNNVKTLGGESAADILLDATDALATEIMDRLNRPWPELADRPGTVLEINVIDGDLVWCSDGKPVSQLGDLGKLALK